MTGMIRPTGSFGQFEMCPVDKGEKEKKENSMQFFFSLLSSFKRLAKPFFYSAQLIT